MGDTVKRAGDADYVSEAYMFVSKVGLKEASRVFETLRLPYMVNKWIAHGELRFWPPLYRGLCPLLVATL